MLDIEKSSKNGLVCIYCDSAHWAFPLCFHYTTVGNRHRPWSFRIEFLCFGLVLGLNEYSRQEVL